MAADTPPESVDTEPLVPDHTHPIHTVHSRAWWREHVLHLLALHLLALRRLSQQSARSRTPSTWLVVR